MMEQLIPWIALTFIAALAWASFVEAQVGRKLRRAEAKMHGPADRYVSIDAWMHTKNKRLMEDWATGPIPTSRIYTTRRRGTEVVVTDNRAEWRFRRELYHCNISTHNQPRKAAGLSRPVKTH